MKTSYFVTINILLITLSYLYFTQDRKKDMSQTRPEKNLSHNFSLLTKKKLKSKNLPATTTQNAKPYAPTLESYSDIGELIAENEPLYQQVFQSFLKNFHDYPLNLSFDIIKETLKKAPNALDYAKLILNTIDTKDYSNTDPHHDNTKLHLGMLKAYTFNELSKDFQNGKYSMADFEPLKEKILHMIKTEKDLYIVSQGFKFFKMVFLPGQETIQEIVNSRDEAERIALRI